MSSLSELVNELLPLVQQMEAAEAHARDLRNQVDQKYSEIKAQMDSTRPVAPASVPAQ